MAASDPKLRPAIQRLLIVRLGSMGDVVHTLPAAAALRQAFPDATIGWLIEERWAELLCTLPEPRSGPRSLRRPIVDRVHVVDTKKWRKDLASAQTWERMAASLSELRAPRYQIAVDFQGAARSALLARWSGAPTIYGAMQPRENIASMMYSRQVIVSGTHVVEQNLSLAAAIGGFPFQPTGIEFPIDESAEVRCENWLREKSIEKFALLNPGAGWGAKQWPAERYGAAGKKLAQHGLKPLINFGPGEEELARSVEDASEGAAETVSSSLTQLIALSRRASLFIGGDTGPMHLAASLGIPVVAIFGPTDPARNGPYGARSVVLRSPDSMTSHKRRVEPEAGLLAISVEDVVRAACRLMEEGNG